MHFGFSYVGLIFLAMLFIPNIIWAKNQPEGYEEFAKKENKVLLAFERVGEVLVSTLVLIFKDLNVRPHSWWLGWLILAALLMVFYECYWIRYFRSKKTMADMYSSFAGFPVAGATLPVMATLFLGIYSLNIFIIGASFILGIGHIGIHLVHRKEAIGGEKSKIKTSKKVGRIIRRILMIPAILVIVFFICIIAVREGNVFRSFIYTKNGVNEEIYLDINGQQQYVQIKGEDTSAPIIVYLHGGPGSPDGMVSYRFTNELVSDYTVVCFDQRGCGRTYLKNDDKENKTATFDQAVADVDTLVDYLLKRFGQDKVIIMGHSYGSVLGSEYVMAHPEKVSAYIGVGQFVSFVSGTRFEYEDALEKAKANGDDTTDLTAAYELFLNEMTLDASSEVSTYASVYHENNDVMTIVKAAIASPNLSSEDLRWYTNLINEGSYDKLCGSLLDYTLNVDLREDISAYPVSAYFISGENDWNCSYPDMIDYAEGLGVHYDLIEGCGHNVHIENPEKFAEIVRTDLGD